MGLIKLIITVKIHIKHSFLLFQIESLHLHKEVYTSAQISNNK